MFRYGARDFRDIGHKAIFVANSLRTLNCIGQQHTEPVLRSLAYALLQHDGENPAKRDERADRPWRRNVERVKEIKADWLAGKPTTPRRSRCWPHLRQANENEACDKVIELLNRGVSPQSIWDALLLGAGELLCASPGIVAAARGDDDERPALRLGHDRQRRNAEYAAAAERGVPADVPRRDGQATCRTKSSTRLQPVSIAAMSPRPWMRSSPT